MSNEQKVVQRGSPGVREDARDADWPRGTAGSLKSRVKHASPMTMSSYMRRTRHRQWLAVRVLRS